MDGKGKNRPPADGRRAGTTFALRIAVSGYLIYLGFTLLRTCLGDASAPSPIVLWICGPLFMAAGLFFILYSWRRYRSERDAAEESGEDAGPDGTSDDGE